MKEKTLMSSLDAFVRDVLWPSLLLGLFCLVVGMMMQAMRTSERGNQVETPAVNPATQKKTP
jgi:hypothetical protein